MPTATRRGAFDSQEDRRGEIASLGRNEALSYLLIVITGARRMSSSRRARSR